MAGRTPYLGPTIDRGTPEKYVKQAFRKNVGKKFFYQMSKGQELDKRQLRGYRRRHQRRIRRWYEEHGGGPDSPR